MDDTELERLLNRYADQLTDEQLEDVVPPELRDRLRAYVRREGRRPRQLLRLGAWGLGVAACVAFIAVLLIPEGPALSVVRFEVSPAVRAPSGEWGTFQIDLALSDPAYLRVVVFDARHEPWVIPFDEDATEFVRRVEATYHAECPRFPDPDDRRGAAEALFVMVIASPGPVPTEKDVLSANYQLLGAPQEASRAALRPRLEGIARDLESRFDCVVRVKPVPTE